VDTTGKSHNAIPDGSILAFDGSTSRLSLGAPQTSSNGSVFTLLFTSNTSDRFIIQQSSSPLNAGVAFTVISNHTTVSGVDAKQKMEISGTTTGTTLQLTNADALWNITGATSARIVPYCEFLNVMDLSASSFTDRAGISHASIPDRAVLEYDGTGTRVLTTGSSSVYTDRSMTITFTTSLTGNFIVQKSPILGVAYTVTANGSLAQNNDTTRKMLISGITTGTTLTLTILSTVWSVSGTTTTATITNSGTFKNVYNATLGSYTDVSSNVYSSLPDGAILTYDNTGTSQILTLGVANSSAKYLACTFTSSPFGYFMIQSATGTGVAYSVVSQTALVSNTDSTKNLPLYGNLNGTILTLTGGSSVWNVAGVTNASIANTTIFMNPPLDLTSVGSITDISTKSYTAIPSGALVVYDSSSGLGMTLGNGGTLSSVACLFTSSNALGYFTIQQSSSAGVTYSVNANGQVVSNASNTVKKMSMYGVLSGTILNCAFSNSIWNVTGSTPVASVVSANVFVNPTTLIGSNIPTSLSGTDSVSNGALLVFNNSAGPGVTLGDGSSLSAVSCMFTTNALGYFTVQQSSAAGVTYSILVNGQSSSSTDSSKKLSIYGSLSGTILSCAFANSQWNVSGNTLASVTSSPVLLNIANASASSFTDSLGNTLGSTPASAVLVYNSASTVGFLALGGTGPASLVCMFTSNALGYFSIQTSSSLTTGGVVYSVTNNSTTSTNTDVTKKMSMVGTLIGSILSLTRTSSGSNAAWSATG
jgi:hypothetical protein